MRCSQFEACGGLQLHVLPVVVGVQPGVPGHLGRADPPLGVPHQQPRDQVLGLGGDVAPLRLREHELSVLGEDIENLTATAKSHCPGPYLDTVEEAALTLVAESSLVPAAALAAGAGEGRVAAEEDVGHYPEAPEVSPLIVNHRSESIEDCLLQYLLPESFQKNFLIVFDFENLITSFIYNDTIVQIINGSFLQVFKL